MFLSLWPWTLMPGVAPVKWIEWDSWRKQTMHVSSGLVISELPHQPLHVWCRGWLSHKNGSKLSHIVTLYGKVWAIIQVSEQIDHMEVKWMIRGGPIARQAAATSQPGRQSALVVIRKTQFVISNAHVLMMCMAKTWSLCLKKAAFSCEVMSLYNATYTVPTLS